MHPETQSGVRRFLSSSSNSTVVLMTKGAADSQCHQNDFLLLESLSVLPKEGRWVQVETGYIFLQS